MHQQKRMLYNAKLKAGASNSTSTNRLESTEKTLR